MARAKPAFMTKHEQARAVQGPPPDQLEAIRAKAKEARNKRLELEELNERVSELGAEINKIEGTELPDLMMEAGVDTLGLEAEGNLPAYDIACKPYYHANIKNEDPTAPEAYAWLQKNGHGDLVKRSYTIAFGKGQEKAAKAFESLLKKSKVEYSSTFGVPWNTLTSFLKEQIEKSKAMKDSSLVPPLDLLNATVGNRVTVKPRKEKAAATAKPRRQSY